MTRTISKHQFDVDDEGFYTCRHCGRVSKDPSIIRELSCVKREHPGTLYAPEQWRDGWTEVKRITTESEYWTQAVADEVMVTEGFDADLIYTQIENDLRKSLAAQGKVPARIKRGFKPFPMTSLPGYSVFRVDAETVPANKREIDERLSLASSMMFPPAGASLSETIRPYMEARMNDQLRTDDEALIGPDPFITSWYEPATDTAAVKIVYWTIPRGSVIVTPEGTSIT